MDNDQHQDARIIASWKRNASPWVNVIRQQEVESRRLVTDQAIIDAVLSHSPSLVLDVGCGEGWLVRALEAWGPRVVGVDVVPELIEVACRSEGGDYRVVAYDTLGEEMVGTNFDVLVCNFSLLGKASVEQVFDAAPSLLASDGALIVQTLHPVMACAGLPYQDGWREGSWAGFGEDFRDPPPWYFRTLESWVSLFVRKGLRLCEVREPLHPESGKPASTILVGKPDRER